MYHWCIQHMYVCVCVCVYTQLFQLCPTLCDPKDHSLPGSSFHGMLQARILEWVATPFSRRSSQSRDQTRVSCVSCISRQTLHHCTTWEALIYIYICPTLCDPMDCSRPGFPVLYYLPDFAQTHVTLSWWCHPAISSSVALSPPALYNGYFFFSFGNPEKENMWWRTEKNGFWL